MQNNPNNYYPKEAFFNTNQNGNNSRVNTCSCSGHCHSQNFNQQYANQNQFNQNYNQNFYQNYNQFDQNNQQNFDGQGFYQTNTYNQSNFGGMQNLFSMLGGDKNILSNLFGANNNPMSMIMSLFGGLNKKTKKQTNQEEEKDIIIEKDENDYVKVKDYYKEFDDWLNKKNSAQCRVLILF